jgi:hypothetical protein
LPNHGWIDLASGHLEYGRRQARVVYIRRKIFAKAHAVATLHDDPKLI